MPRSFNSLVINACVVEIEVLGPRFIVSSEGLGLHKMLLRGIQIQHLPYARQAPYHSAMARLFLNSFWYQHALEHKLTCMKSISLQSRTSPQHWFRFSFSTQNVCVGESSRKCLRNTHTHTHISNQSPIDNEIENRKFALYKIFLQLSD